MALNLNKNLKLYYSIREVAEMFGVNESTLRYWEQEFPYLKPKVSGSAKIRQYQEKDIEQIRLIHNLDSSWLLPRRLSTAIATVLTAKPRC